jgi:hypothetical protein
MPMDGQEQQNGRPDKAGSSLWAWVAEDGAEGGVARLQQAWLPLGTINLVGFSREVMADPRLVEALQEQADRDGQTVRLVRFALAEEALTVRPRQGNPGGGGAP